jgi:hypothetical protein
MVESHVKEWVAAGNSNDPETAARLDPPANGFGYRELKSRSAEIPASTRLGNLKVFFASFEYYRITLNEVQTDVDGDIGLAWGFYTEEFKRKAQNPEKVRVRFSITFKYQQGRWRTLLYHRDIQQFDDQGRYLPSPPRGAN